MDEQQVVEEVKQTAEAASPAVPKRGETARQQIRKAKVVSRRKVGEAETGENEPITRQNPPVGQAGSRRQRMFR